MNIGYIRISTADQNTARQEVLMQELGVDQVYIDLCLSGQPRGEESAKEQKVNQAPTVRLGTLWEPSYLTAESKV